MTLADTMIEEDPMVCYVLMRTDLPDYLSGKSMAQSHHAGTHFMDAMRRLTVAQARWTVPFEEWLAQGRGFGTTIVLGVTHRELRELVMADHGEEDRIVYGVVHDPSYPVRDGDLINHMPVNTCGYVFGRRSACSVWLSELPLFREPKKKH